eukprot:Gb_03127 [translate_table: standard]
MYFDGEELFDYEFEDLEDVDQNIQFQTREENFPLAEDNDCDDLYGDLKDDAIQSFVPACPPEHQVECSKKDSEEDDRMEVNKKYKDLILDLRNWNRRAVSSISQAVADGCTGEKKSALFEEDESRTVWALCGPKSYDKREEEGDNFGLFQTLTPAGSWQSAGAVESTTEASRRGDSGARNGTVCRSGSGGSGKVEGLTVLVTSWKTEGDVPGAPCLRADTPTTPVLIPSRTGPTRDFSWTAPDKRMDDSYSLDSGETGATVLYVGNLHYWITDADLEAAFLEYGRVKEFKFFEAKASGISKGFCRVEFYDHAVARACKEGMNGCLFDGRPCVVVFASNTSSQLDSVQASENHIQEQQQPIQREASCKRMINNRGSSSYGRGEGGSISGRMCSGRNGHRRDMGARGQVQLGRGGRSTGRRRRYMEGRGTHEQWLSDWSGDATRDITHSQVIAAQGFNSLFGPHVESKGVSYGGFLQYEPLFFGMTPPLLAVGMGGLCGHVNPTFLGAGTATANGMGMVPNDTLEEHHSGMWMDSSMGGCREDVNREDEVSEDGYGMVNLERERLTVFKDREGRGNFSVTMDRQRGEDSNSVSDSVGTSQWKHLDDYKTDREVGDRGLDFEFDGVSDEKERANVKKYRGTVTYVKSQNRNQDHGGGDQDQEQKDRDWYRMKDRDGYRDGKRRDQDWENNELEGKNPLLTRSKGGFMEEGDGTPQCEETDHIQANLQSVSSIRRVREWRVVSDLVGTSEWRCKDKRETYWDRDHYRLGKEDRMGSGIEERRGPNPKKHKGREIDRDWRRTSKKSCYDYRDWYRGED